MSRRIVVDAFNRVSFAAELLGDKSLDARGFGQVAWAMRSLDGDFAVALESGAVAKIPGMSSEMLELVEQVAAGLPAPLLASLEEQVPEGLFEVRRIKGLGSKKIKALWDGLGITTVAELEYACNENRLVELKGFGQKTQDKVLEAIAELHRTEGHLRLDQMQVLADALIAQLQPVYEEVLAVGMLSRGRETLDSLELLARSEDEDPLAALSVLEEGGATDGYLDDEGDLACVRALLGKTKIAVWIAPDEDRMGGVRVALSSSDEYRARLFARARERGVNFDLSGAKDTPTEESVYALLELAFVPGERRDDGHPLVELGSARKLVQLADLKGALHNHTTASDGVNTLVEMRDAAAAFGLGYLAITEHSVTANYAGGLDAARLRAQRSEVDALNAQGASCVLLHGVESDILREGELDYDDEVLGSLDLVVASVHGRHGQNAEEMTARMVRAASHKYVDCIGHPTGRLLLGRAPTEFDVEKLLDACRESGCAIELNANPARLDLHEAHLALAKEKGVPVSIAADAHSTKALTHLQYGLIIARRAGLGPDDVLNTMSLEQLRGWLAQRRA